MFSFRVPRCCAFSAGVRSVLLRHTKIDLCSCNVEPTNIGYSCRKSAKGTYQEKVDNLHNVWDLAACDLLQESVSPKCKLNIHSFIHVKVHCTVVSFIN